MESVSNGFNGGVTEMPVPADVLGTAAAGGNSGTCWKIGGGSGNSSSGFCACAVLSRRSPSFGVGGTPTSTVGDCSTGTGFGVAVGSAVTTKTVGGANGTPLCGAGFREFHDAILPFTCERYSVGSSGLIGIGGPNTLAFLVARV